VFSSPVTLVCKSHQGVDTRLGLYHDTTAITAVTTAWTAARNVLLATKRHTAVTATTGDDFYFDPVDKHGLNLLLLNNTVGQDVATAQRLK
jgi:triacylglycerol esterase/lipase EstA (alpha/beta hydrolase family)